MPYHVKNYKGASIASVLEGTVNTQTPLKLVGQNYKNYGQLIAENFVHIVENFSRDIAPTNPIVGQLWYKPSDGHIYMLDQDANNKTKWKSMATMDIRTTDPVDDASGYTPREGDFWFNSSADAGILNIRYRNDETGALQWGQLSVPVAADATLLFQNVYDDSAAGQTTTPPVSHACIKFVVDSRIIGIYSTGETEWSPLGKLQGTPLQIQSGGSSVTYDVESHPDGSALHLSFPYINSGLTLSGGYDPDLQTGSTEGRSYQVKFPAPAAGGTMAEGYPVINKALQSIESIVITNQGSGYTASTISTWNTNGASAFDQVPAGQGPSGTAPALTAVLGTAGTEFEDKIISVTVGNDTNSKAGGNGYFTPPIKPSLNGNIRVGRNASDFADFSNLQAGFGRKIIAINILSPGTGYTNGTIIIQAPGGEDGTTATATITTDGGAITAVTMGLQGDGYTYAPSSANSGITFTGTAGAGNGDAVLLAVLGDDRLMLDSNSISGDKIHGGNISSFESSAISDLTNWHRNDPGIQGLTTRDGYGTDEGETGNETSVHNTDKALWSSYTYSGGVDAWKMDILDTSDALQRRRAGYVNVTYEREQTLGTTSGAVTADGALRVDGGAHIGKNLHVNGSVSVTGSLYTGGNINNIEVNNLTIEDNLIELNKSQTDLASGGGNAGSAPLEGISGLYIDRGLLGNNQVPFSTLLWDDSDFLLSGTTPTGGGPINKQEDFFKLGTFTGKTEGDLDSEEAAGDDPEDGSLNQDTISGFKLANLDALMYTAQAGAKCDIISDSQGHEAVPTDRDVGGFIARYNGYPQDSAAAAYPNTLADANTEYNDDNSGYPGKDLILVDSDERIIRGEFHFYRDAYPCDGSDSLVNTGVSIGEGGASSSKANGHSGDNLFIIRDGAVTTHVDSPGTFMRGSGGPGARWNTAGGALLDLDATDPNITSATWAGADITNSFLEDPVWFVDSGEGQVCALREGRAIGWNRPRVHIHDLGNDYGTGACIIPVVGLDGTISSAEAITKGKHYTGTAAIGIVGEARDSTTANTSIGKDGIITATYTSDTITAAGASGGSNYRTPKPFKEVNSTKFNGVLCADPSQINGIPAPIIDGPHVTDSAQKYVGLYPIMDGHNDGAFDDTLPFNGSGMTIGTHNLHFVDAFIRNIRTENHWNDEEALTILNRATHGSGTSAKARTNVGAIATHVGKAETHIYANGGPDDSGGEGVINVKARSQGDAQSKILLQTYAQGDTLSHINIVARTNGATGGHTAGTQESKIYMSAQESLTHTGSVNFPYGQRTFWDGAAPGSIESATNADDGNEVHIQAADMVVIERTDTVGRTSNVPTGTVGTMNDWLTRFEVDAKDTRLNGHIHLGDGTLINPGTTDLWDRHVFFNSFVGSHVMPATDSDDASAALDGQGWDLGATNAETSVSDHHGGLTVTGTTDKRWRTLYVRNISAGSNSETGLIDGDWSLSDGSTLQSTYTADLAERYEADDDLEAGTVVAMGGDKEVTATTSENDENVFGVVSTEPAFIMNGRAGTNETHPLIAMTGRCPCKVVGKINKGDRLVSSSTPGRARKADLTNDSVFAIIGRAIEAHDSDGEGTIEIAVTRN